jgi:hypothetical protein
MNVSELLQDYRKTTKMTTTDLAKSLKIPLVVLSFLEDPAASEESLIAYCKSTLKIEPPCTPVPQPIAAPSAPVLKMEARFPAIRAFLVAPERCQDPVRAVKMFDKEPFSLAERNLILYLSTTALYHFCNTNTSHFAFDEYLFALHASLLARFEKENVQQGGTIAEQEERLRAARSNIFACERMENIAILVAEKFMIELEAKLVRKETTFSEDMQAPFTWTIDETYMKIAIHEPGGALRDEIKLLDVKPNR